MGIVFDSNLKRLYWYIFAGMKGGPTRIKMVKILLQKPLNINQIKTELGMDYKTILHHLEVLKKNNWVTAKGDRYGNLFFTAFTGDEKAAFHEIWAKIREKNFK